MGGGGIVFVGCSGGGGRLGSSRLCVCRFGLFGFTFATGCCGSSGGSGSGFHVKEGGCPGGHGGDGDSSNVGDGWLRSCWWWWLVGVGWWLLGGNWMEYCGAFVVVEVQVWLLHLQRLHRRFLHLLRLCQWHLYRLRWLNLLRLLLLQHHLRIYSHQW